MSTRRSHTVRTAASVAAMGLAALAWAGGAAASGGHHGDGGPGVGDVFTQTNAEGPNAILAFDRAADGSLTPAGSFATGGEGSGDGLGSQGAVVLERHWLLAVNAGSDEVSVLRVGRGGPRLADVEPSGGDRPISVTVHGRLVYVVNAGGAGNVSGFRIDRHGDLTPIAGSRRPLSTDAAAPAQVQFSPDGDTLVVTEKAANAISSWPVRRDGTLGPAEVTPSSGATPFGFDFDRRGRLFVSEAFGGDPGASALSSYRVARGGGLDVVSNSVPTLQTAACWVAVTGSGRYAYATNTGSDSITGYAIGRSGAVTRLDADGVTARTGATPTDVALSGASRYLYAHGASDGSLSGFRVGADGSLQAIGATTGLPASAAGLAAR